MNDKSDDLEPLNVEKLMAQFSDFTIAELVLEIKEGREKLEHEQKVCAAKEFKLQKAEEELETLRGRINTSITVLGGESDICIDCEAVKEPEKEKEKEEDK